MNSSHPMRSHQIFFKIHPTKEVSEMVDHVRRFDASSVAQEKLKILLFYKQYGEKACKDAFGVDRKTIYVWRKRYEASQKKLVSLIPHSTAPNTRRTMDVHPKVLAYIQEMRKEHVRLGKRKIKPLLDVYCQKENLPICSEAKIGRIIKKNKLFYQKTGRVYHNANSKWNEAKKRKKRDRIRHPVHPSGFGHIQMDTIIRIENGIKYYLYSCVDVKGKFAFSLPYKTNTATNTLDFFTKLEYIYPYQITSVQTDNGSEFLGVFDMYLTKNKIRHFFIYPRCPRINGCVERFNRSIQEEFVDPNVHLIHNQKEFQRKLAEYMIFYNCQRAHQTLNFMTPIDYLLLNGGLSNMYRSRT